MHNIMDYWQDVDTAMETLYGVEAEDLTIDTVTEAYEFGAPAGEFARDLGRERGLHCKMSLTTREARLLGVTIDMEG